MTRLSLPRASATTALWAVLLGALLVSILTIVMSSHAEDRAPWRQPLELWTLGIFFLTIVIGELNRITLPGATESAPMSTAGAYGLALSMSLESTSLRYGSSLCIVVTALAMGVGMAIQARRSRAAGLGEVGSRLLAAIVAALLFRTLPVVDGQPFALMPDRWEGRRWLLAIAMVTVSALASAAGGLTTAMIDVVDHGVPVRAAFRDQLGQVFGLNAALVSSGALIALAERALGVFAVPVFLLPLVLTQFALRRYAEIRKTYRQTIGTLSRLTEVGGYTPAAHPARVASLSVDMARLLGVPAREVVSLEYAALLHDIGQLALRTPIPQGATMMAAPADQDLIARDGAEIVRTTGVLDDVVEVLEVQAKPYRHVRELGEAIPMAARIIKVANAYDDLAGDRPSQAQAAAALERIHLGLGYEYDPAVVEALERVLDQRRTAYAGQGAPFTARA